MARTIPLLDAAQRREFDSPPTPLRTDGLLLVQAVAYFLFD